MTKGNGKVREFMDATDMVSDAYKRSNRKAVLIPMSKEFMERTIEDQSNYWHKLASSLNHACQQIQKERDELNTILFSKEAQLTQLKKQMDADRNMIQQQLMNENKKRQELLEENQKLQRRITELGG